MKKVILAAMVATAAAQYRSCGNCRVEGTFAGRCNTGAADLIPYNVSTAVPAGDLNGTNQAQAVPISEIRTTVGETEWRTMFCSDYIGRYKDGFGSANGGGAACVRTLTKASILAADKEARDAYVRFGTSNGYASSFAVSKGTSANLIRFGVDGTGDVPTNWCGVYMKYMTCHVAFPQVVIAAADLATMRASGPWDALSTSRTAHYIRTVNRDSCDTLFDVCNRREPTTAEKKSNYQPPEQVGLRAQYFLNNNTRRKLESDAFCAMWELGFGLSAAGNGVSAGNFTMEFEAGSHFGYSVVLVVVALLSVIVM